MKGGWVNKVSLDSPNFAIVGNPITYLPIYLSTLFHHNLFPAFREILYKVYYPALMCIRNEYLAKIFFNQQF